MIRSLGTRRSKSSRPGYWRGMPATGSSATRARRADALICSAAGSGVIWYWAMFSVRDSRR